MSGWSVLLDTRWFGVWQREWQGRGCWQAVCRLCRQGRQQEPEGPATQRFGPQQRLRMRREPRDRSHEPGSHRVQGNLAPIDEPQRQSTPPPQTATERQSYFKSNCEPEPLDGTPCAL